MFIENIEWKTKQTYYIFKIKKKRKQNSKPHKTKYFRRSIEHQKIINKYIKIKTFWEKEKLYT